MSEVPERIWAFAPDIFDNCSLWQDMPSPAGDTIEYIRADHVDVLLKAEREKALRVKPLEWLDGNTHGSMYDYRIYGVRRGRGGVVSSVFLERDQWGSRVQIAKCIPEETAKAAAQADYEARILALIENPGS